MVRGIIAEHSSASNELAHAHLPIDTASKGNVSLLIFIVIHTLVSRVRGIWIVFVTAFSSWAILRSLLNIHANTTAVLRLIILLLHPAAQSFIWLSGWMLLINRLLFALVLVFEHHAVLNHGLPRGVLLVVYLASAVRLLGGCLLLLVHVLLYVYVFTLDHWDQNGVSLAQFYQFFGGFHVNVVEWLLPLEIGKQFRISYTQILDFLTECENGLLHFVLFKLPFSGGKVADRDLRLIWFCWGTHLTHDLLADIHIWWKCSIFTVWTNFFISSLPFNIQEVVLFEN